MNARFTSINPATGETFAEYDEHADEAVEDRLQLATVAQAKWKTIPISERAQCFTRVAEKLGDRSNELAELMALEMGKPLREGRAEVAKCSWVCSYYAENAGLFLKDETIETEASESFVAYRPLGTILAIMPWNFPFWQLFRFAAPTLMAGNAAILKHAPNTPGCALAIERLFADAHFPPGLFANLFLSNERTEALIGNPAITGVTLTGSTRAGKAVARAAGAALKKVVLELGGSDAYVLLDDAGLEDAAETCVTSRMINSGQSCIAAKRLIVLDRHLDVFERLVTESVSRYVVGDPLDEATDIGPLARNDLRTNLHDQVVATMEMGAKCLVGGDISQGPGFYYPPTVLSGVGPGMPAYGEEMFGPVAVIIPAKDEAEAIRIANDSSFGLGAVVFSRNVARARSIAREELDAGCCFVNDFVRSDPRLPFGGIKESGIGRELGRLGILEFVNAKTVYVS